MATTAYHPDDTDCNSWYGLSAAIPPSSETALEDTLLSSSAETDISTSNDTHQTHGADGSNYPGFETAFAIGEDPAEISKITATAEGHAIDGSGIALTFRAYLYDFDAGAWVVVGSDTSGSDAVISTDFTSDLSRFVSGGVVKLCAIADGTNFGDVVLIDQFEVSVTAEVEVVVAVVAPLNHGHVLDIAQRGAVGASSGLAHAHTLDAVFGTRCTPGIVAGLTHTHSLDATTGAWPAADQPVDIHHGHLLDTLSGAQQHAADAASLSHGHGLDAPTGTQQHAATPASLSHGHGLDAPGVVVWGPVIDGLHHTHSLEIAAGTYVVAAPPLSLSHGHSVGTPAATQQHTATPARLLHDHTAETPLALLTIVGTPGGTVCSHTLDTLIGTQQHSAAVMSLDHAHTLETTLGYLHVHLYVSVPGDGVRRLSWDEVGTVYVVIDGDLEGEAVGYLDMAADRTVRGILVAYLDLPDDLPTPRDVVMLSITGNPAPVQHRLRRQFGGGDWQTVATIHAGSYRDGPLADGSYSYRAVAVDTDGDTTESDICTVTISSAPDPPSGLDWAWDADTSTLTLTWQASPSPDVASYRVRQGEDLLSWTADSVQDSSDLEYAEEIDAGTTGVLIFSVRAVDTDGHEESNVSQVLAIPFEDGAPAARPAEPRWIEARAVEDGKIELEWLYDPAYEYLGPGAAYEARIYWDDGTGEIDFSEPHATVEIGYPTEATRYAWQSAPLTDGQEYRFVVRVATAPWPGGIETQNTNAHAATADATGPLAPALTATVV